MSRFQRSLWVLLTLSLLLALPAAAGSGKGDDAYTVWLIVFNNPAGCTDPCGEDDIFVDAATPETCIAFFTGGRVQSNGRAAFAASYGEGTTVGQLFCLSASGATLEDDSAAEIHFVVRTHDKYVASIADAQISTFGGGCDPITDEPCGDVQAAVFTPAGPGTTSVFNLSDGSTVSGSSATLWREGDGIRATIHTRVP